MTRDEIDARADLLFEMGCAGEITVPLVRDGIFVTTRDPVACPACGKRSRAAVSQSMFFAEDKLAFRCGDRSCRYVWKVSPRILTRDQWRIFDAYDLRSRP